MAQKLTDKMVRELPAPATGNRIEYDSEVRGLGLRITAADARSWVINYRNAAGRERRLTIGSYPAWNVRQARTRAAELRRDIDAGYDPLADREAARVAAVTVAELCDRYLIEHAEAKKRPRSVEEDRRNLRLHVIPKLGKVAVAAVTRDDIARLHSAMMAAPIGANRVLSLLSKMFSLAETWGLRPQHTNPCRGLDRYRERSRERLMTADELARLGDALAAHKGHGPAAIRLLCLTGMRKSEVLSLRWADVDLGLGWIRLADSKTGAKTVPLGAPALALLAELPRVADNPYVFPSPRPPGEDAAAVRHFVNVEGVWRAVVKAAGLTDLRLHDLRHGFASVGAMGGDSLFILGKLLGHKNQATTQRYAHLQNDPLRAVADRISGKVAAALDGKNADILDLRHKAQ